MGIHDELTDSKAVKVEHKVSPPRKRRAKGFERNPPLTNSGRDEIKRWLRDDRPPLTHNPFADAIKKGEES
jgi:hypothetical protein